MKNSGNILGLVLNQRNLRTSLVLASCLASSAVFAIPPGPPPGLVTITFNNLVGQTGDPFSAAYVENGFTVTTAAAGWLEDHGTGNPVPALFGSVTTGTLDVTDGGTGNFLFNSVDLAGNGATYSIVGKLGGVTEFTINSGSPLTAAFTTVPNPNESQAIDNLFITMTAASAGPNLLAKFYDVDNIGVIVQTPEPSTFLIGGLGAAAVLFFRRRK
jgi:hypothetical protein